MAALIREFETFWPELHQNWKTRLNGNRWPHAVLLVGPSGVGKTWAAHAVAQSLLCENPEQGLACGVCVSCKRFEKRAHPSYLEVEPKNLQITIDQAHLISEFLSLRSFTNQRVVVIKQAHLMNVQAANSLLKLIEEPPIGTYFLLTALSPSIVLSTIQSRCQISSVKPLTVKQLASKKGNDIEDWKLRSARGCLKKVEAFELEDFQRLRKVAFDGLNALLPIQSEKQPVPEKQKEEDELLEAFKNKSEGLQIIYFLKQFLRDLIWLNVGGAPLHPDFGESYNKMKKIPSSLVHRHLLDLEAIEQDWVNHVDRSLLFEVLKRRLNPAIGTSN